MSASIATESYACIKGYSSSEIEIGSRAANRWAKSSRSRMRATVIVRARRTTSAYDSLPSHSPLKRISDPRRVVADDQDDRVTRPLELREPIEDESEAEMDVRRRRVDAELDAKR